MFMDSATSGWCSDLLYGLRVLLFCHPTPHASPTQFRTESPWRANVELLHDRLTEHDMNWKLDDWRYPATERRDSRLDLLRGFAVFAMICDHVAGVSWFSPVTGA